MFRLALYIFFIFYFELAILLQPFVIVQQYISVGKRFSNPAATLQSSIKLEQLVDLVKRISLQDLYNQTNVQLETGAVASKHHGDNETEGIKPMEFHIKAVDQDAVGSNQMGMSVSRLSRARKLTKKGRKYQAELVLEKVREKIAEKGRSNR